MKVQNTKKTETSATLKIKKKNKRKKKKHVELQRRIFDEIKFDVSSDESIQEITSDSNKKMQTLTVDKLNNSSENDLTLTPSKSERDSSGCLISGTDISCNLTEESFNSTLPEDDSFCYDNIVDEFIINEDDQVDAKIVAAPVTRKKKKNTPKIQIHKEGKPVIKSKPQKSESPCCSSSFAKDNVKAQYHYTSDGIIVILEKDQTIHFHGLMLMSVLHGEVEVLGHIITKNNRDVKLYSPRGTSLLYITNITTSEVSVTNYLTNLPEKIKFSDKSAIIFCKNLEDPSITFIEKHMSQQILPKSDESHLPRAVFQPKGSWNLLKPSNNWNSIINGIHKSTKMMICGGKGVGKTTFLRYAINKLLTKFNEILIIDLDPGQSEFTIPGCISVVKVKEPVFGVNYTHLKSSEMSLLSNISIGYEPAKYIATIKHLLDSINVEEIPTLVNFMGYTHGIGINILSAAIVHVQPTDVLQIDSLNPKKNYKCRLTPDVVRENAKLFVSSIPSEFHFNLQQIHSMSDKSGGWTAEPRQLREMCILAYISQMIHSNSIFNSKLPLYKVDLAMVKITDLQGASVHPAAINAGLVALCSLVEKSFTIFKCLGWGIVRGIDLGSNVIILSTLQELETLGQVSHLVLSSINLPPSLYMTPDEVTGQVPYVIEGVLMSLGQIPKRSRMPIKN